MRVAILDDIHDAFGSTEAVARLRERAEVRIFTGPFGEPEALGGFDALVANRERTRFTRDLLEQLSDLRIIVQTGNHAYHVDFEAAKALGVVVAKASGGTSVGTAELAIGLAIAVMRRIPACDAAVKRGEWPAPLTPVLCGKTLGIVGLGRLGGYVARLGLAFGMRVLAWSPTLDAARARTLGAEYSELDALMGTSDVVSIHVSLKPETRGLIDRRRIALMKPTSVLVNTSRGPIVEESALVEALRENRILGAGLDVFDREPLLSGHPLTTLPNVVLTPHIGWTTDQGYGQFAEAAVGVLIDYLEGRDVPRFGI
jgi:phosphoglycerate dehydrogenase-like enzyme